VRIGTWNLAGRWSDAHQRFLLERDCDVWLLTEVNERLVLPGFAAHLTESSMADERRWAGVLSRHDIRSHSDPHPASAMADTAGLTFCSSILPWRACGSGAPWSGGTHADKTAQAITRLLRHLPRSGLVWGGDWNQALEGPEYAGSKGGRHHVKEAVARLGLTVATADLPHRIARLSSIDHVAVPQGVAVTGKEHHDGIVGATRLSDHDAYVITMDPAPTPTHSAESRIESGIST
jgi:hypothetical protein